MFAVCVSFCLTACLNKITQEAACRRTDLVYCSWSTANAYMGQRTTVIRL